MLLLFASEKLTDCNWIIEEQNLLCCKIYFGKKNEIISIKKNKKKTEKASISDIFDSVDHLRLS